MPDPQIQAAQRARVPYLEPEGTGDPVGRRARRPATVPLAESYARTARTAGQPAVTAWRDQFLTVVPTGLVDGLEEVTRRAVVEAHDRTCPMRVDDVAGERCVMRGGPWTSGSIHAAAIWAAHRRLLLARLGCDSCDDGARPTLGPLGSMRGPVTLAEPVLASRYGGYAWR